jgi:hypothetical protein
MDYGTSFHTFFKLGVFGESRGPQKPQLPYSRPHNSREQEKPATLISSSFKSRHPAGEICGVVDAAGALIARHLRIRTERPRPGNAARRIAVGLVFGREDLVRRRALLHPMLKRGSSVRLGKGFSLIGYLIAVPKLLGPGPSKQCRMPGTM